MKRRIAQLEDKLKNGVIKEATTVSRQMVNTTQNTINKTVKTDNLTQVNKANKTEARNKGPITKEWSNIVNDLKANGKIMLYTNLINTNAVELNDMTIGIEFPNGINAFGKTVLEKAENKATLEKEVSMVSGKAMNIKYIDLKENSSNEQNDMNNIENMMNGLDIPFNIID